MCLDILFNLIKIKSQFLFIKYNTVSIIKIVIKSAVAS